MKWICIAALMCVPFMLQAQNSSSPTDPLSSLSFLEGDWKAQSQGSSGVVTSGRYAFRRELGGHVLARHSTSDPNCKAPASFDCEHRDLLYVFPGSDGKALKAIYFDSEGHVIHYDVAVPHANSVVFESESAPGPRFRLTYELVSGTMTGKFQMQAPGSSDWHSYLEWSGGHE